MSAERLRTAGFAEARAGLADIGAGLADIGVAVLRGGPVDLREVRDLACTLWASAAYQDAQIVAELREASAPPAVFVNLGG
jgi:hypothetical protein